MSKTDRELLELAAKAAGYKVQQDTWCDELIRITDDGADVCSWNPWIDDGDALRLAGQLGMHVNFDGFEIGYRFGGLLCVSRIVLIDDGLMAATRRAIVRAAATIGRAM